MTSTLATIHVLYKSNYSKHHLMTIPLQALPTLDSSLLGFRPEILDLTTNNLTYARRGHLMGWYDVYPLPYSMPVPYNDSSAYGRIASWGYADIIESTVPDIPVGKISIWLFTH
jgi:hypothetical protein